MDEDLVWKHIDDGRLALADLLDSLTDEQWRTPSLCDGWTVRDVGAHLTLAHARLRDVLVPTLKAGLRFDRMIRDTAISCPVTRAEVTGGLRSFVGSRRTAVGVTRMEPLLDILVHTQDIAVPLGIDVAMPTDAAVAAAERTFAYRGPLRFTRRYDDLTFVATDADWRRGTAPAVVEGPIRELLLALTGRSAGRERLSGAVDRL